MASNLTVKVHPVIYMAIVDAYERRSSSNIGKTVSTAISSTDQKKMESRALGTLLGFYEKNVVQVTNCYAIPFRDTGDGKPEINDNFNRTMWLMSKRSSPSEQIVGWFFTVQGLPDTCAYYQSYFTQLMAQEATKKELPPVILLTMDMTFKEKRLPLKAFTARDAGVPGKESKQTNIFYPLNVEMDAFPGEAVAMNFVMRGIESERREIRFNNGEEQLLECTENLLEWLKRIMVYVQNVLSGKEAAKPAIGRKLMELVNLSNTQLSPEKLESLAKHSLRDYLMVSLLANLVKTQLALQEKITSI